MSINLLNNVSGEKPTKNPPTLLAVTPHRTGERTLLGVENMLQSIAVPEPFSLEIAGDANGVSLMVRCQEDRVVRQQLASHYPQARVRPVTAEDDPLEVGGGEAAWAMTLRSGGPEYAPLRTFRDQDLLDAGSDPLLAVIGSLSNLRPGERIVSRLLLRSLGPAWSQGYLQQVHQQPVAQGQNLTNPRQNQGGRPEGAGLVILGALALIGLKGYQWVQQGEMVKAVLLGIGSVLGLAVAGWAWSKWQQGRNRVHDPLLVKEKVNRVAFAGELQVVAILPAESVPHRAGELLEPVAAAYRHYDHPAGAQFRVGKMQPAQATASLQPGAPGFFGKRSVLGIREVAALWHPPGEGDETPLVERSGAKSLPPPARSVAEGAPVGEATAGSQRDVRFSPDLLRRHHLYVARTRMGKSTLMGHVIAHKLREKAEGRDGDAIVVIDPHADLVAGLLEQVPDGLADRVKLIDLADQRGAPGINLLDTRIFADRDRTADSVVRVMHGLWEQWGPRMQSILEHTVKSLHEANGQVERDRQYTILDGLRLVAEPRFRREVLGPGQRPLPAALLGPGLPGLEPGAAGRGHRPGADPPGLLRFLEEGPGHPGPVPFHHRPAGDHPGRWHPAGVHRPGQRGPGRGGPGGRLPAQPGGLGDPGTGEPAPGAKAGRAGGGGRDAVPARRGLRGHAQRAG